ncbi:Zinc finger AN1 and C2H2 domain-containing stress-associated protein 13 [Sesamum angolense]|uniref:Zinc finger AN1 and C2H2 domain-containing stress-associated protein 13 n=1 Tax=Sesamum angolense TaxID=2727404 RepID=A0AAE1WFR8_9LAMI|nr:Zinc finger AN1 and C2H2 domain-containing stress-associated protein 13 [Sesamum angolense]
MITRSFSTFVIIRAPLCEILFVLILYELYDFVMKKRLTRERGTWVSSLSATNVERLPTSKTDRFQKEKMGTPAIPNLGKHCSVEDCRQIDFLPFTCDCCRQIYCLEHRSYSRHQCMKAKESDVTVVICPLCAKGVPLIPEEDPNITWESHVNVECDPSNYDKVTKKRTCPVPGCRGILTFSNTIKCRDCSVDHCLKHRFGPDHNCPGPKKSEAAFQFMGFLNRSRKEELNQAPGASSSSWATSLFKAASSVRASAEAGMARLTPSSVRATAEAECWLD